MKQPVFPLRVFYDGGCLVCATEIEHYLRRDRLDRLVPVDISRADFDCDEFGISQQEFMHELHALDRQGTVYRGVDAFWAIWQAFPAGSGYALLGKTINLPIISHCARIAYRVFARGRKYLPKRKPVCEDGRCDLHKKG
jgi:predicted DCC family thiol-disulfide oxidoreductase YuxK